MPSSSSSALLLGLGGGLAACGDDDDAASDTVTGQIADSSAPATTEHHAGVLDLLQRLHLVGPVDDGTAVDDDGGGGRHRDVGACRRHRPAAHGRRSSRHDDDDRSCGRDAASRRRDDDRRHRRRPPPPAAATPAGSEPAGTVTESSGPTTSAGPTTTGPECTFTDNEEFPLVRCDAGPPIAAVQSVLQVLEYEIGTVDCLFGDQTHYAVRAFQTDQELTVSGEVDEDTWAALEESFLPDWGTDTNGNGSIEPNEITLTCA